MRNKNIQKIAYAALLIALDMILMRLSPMMGELRIDFQLIISAFAGYLLGPYWAGAALVASDLLGFTLFPGPTGLFLGYTLSALLRGLAFGFLLYKKTINPIRLTVAMVVIFIPLDWFLSTLWIHYISGLEFLPLLLTRILPKAIQMAGEIVIALGLIQLFPLLRNKIKRP